MVGVLVQTPKASGLGGTIGGGDGGLGGGYRTRRGLERQIYWTTWVLVAAFLVCSIANIWVTTASRSIPVSRWPPPLRWRRWSLVRLPAGRHGARSPRAAARRSRRWSARRAS